MHKYYIMAGVTYLTDIAAVLCTAIFYSRTFFVLRAKKTAKGTNSQANSRRKLLSSAFGLVSLSYMLCMLPKLVVGSFGLYYTHTKNKIRNQYPDFYRK